LKNFVYGDQRLKGLDFVGEDWLSRK